MPAEYFRHFRSKTREIDQRFGQFIVTVLYHVSQMLVNKYFLSFLLLFFSFLFFSENSPPAAETAFFKKYPYRDNAARGEKERDEEKSSMVVGRDVVPDVGDANG